ncbi:UDP-galactose transporter Gms1 [Coniosporium apollinis]|uniref:UDP-galactose transporter Gms1 n=1 Tax=Coniosporium apollinis TaxID=61459 RepID=A0ABQ9NW40_9PEZI|nr:UDP-galactose transporter Gms1 [Coniosporium apollinis]
MGVESARRAASWGGVPMKHISLVTLTFQNSALILIMHYSRIMPPVDGHRYFTSTAVFLNEVIKLALSLTMSLYEISSTLPASAPASALFSSLSTAVFTGDSWKLAIPAMLYTLQNSLQYIAVSNLDAATFQVTYQLKILTTALFSVMMLGRSLSLRKWLSLLLLMVGIAIVQIPAGGDPTAIGTLKDGQRSFYLPRSIEELRDLGSIAAQQLSKRSATYEGIDEDVAMQNPQLNASIGLVAVIAACILSGLAGVYFEKVLKDANATASLWVRNVQLSFYSLFPALFLGVFFKDGEQIAKTGFFVGYNWVVWTAITFQALGGVVVALVVNYADNIAKNFATSISIVISLLASVFFFNFEMSSSYLAGTSIVLLATYLYSSQDRLRPPPIRIAEYEKTTVGGDPSYFDLEPASAAKVRTPGLRGDALTTSRPGTPTVERHHHRGNSERKQFPKRDE